MLKLIDYSSTSYPRVESVFASHEIATEKREGKTDFKWNWMPASVIYAFIAVTYRYSKCFLLIRPINWICFLWADFVHNCSDYLNSWNSNRMHFNSDVFFLVCIYQVVPVEVGQLTVHVLPMTLNVPKCTIVLAWRQLNRCISSLTTMRTATSTWLNRMM